MKIAIKQRNKNLLNFNSIKCLLVYICLMLKYKDSKNLLQKLTKQQIVLAAQKYEKHCILDSNNYADQYGKFEYLAAIGAVSELSTNKNSFSQLSGILAKNEWLFGGFSYDLKNQLEDLNSKHPNKIGFADIFFFQPKFLLIQKNKGDGFELLHHETINELDGEKFLLNILESKTSIYYDFPKLKSRIEKKEYINRIIELKRHIQRGDIYEINFCQEFYADQCEFNPYATFITLNQASPMPFAAFLRWNSSFLLSASPERYICKRINKIISQPIKGTIKRGTNNEDDEGLKIKLKNDPKEQNENVMIVDLVRNDLSKIAARGSVKVEELFGIYTFPQLHQMISTVSADLDKKYSALEVIKATFPMGSMTGAPKISAMNLIEKTEDFRRGLYSGAVGYFSPDGDFDFNVVIRSLQYNADNKYLSLAVGGAITSKCEAENEYEECLLKAKAIFDMIKKEANAE